MPIEKNHPPPPAGAVLALRAEATARRAVPTLVEAGVEPILLKGPTLEPLLYGPGERRSYVDLDLLVAPAAQGAAESCLRELGFRAGQSGWSRLSRAWSHPTKGLADLDLHVGLVGATADLERLWSEVSLEAVPWNALGAKCMGVPWRLAHVAIHAAQHGVEGAGVPDEDLGRALARTDLASWHEALLRARRIDAEEALAAGLRMLPAGREVAERLGLRAITSLDVALRATSTYDPMVLGLEQLKRTDGTAAKAKFAAGKTLPGRLQMKNTSSLARRGLPGLILAYLIRLLTLPLVLPRAVWRRKRIKHELGDDAAKR